MSIFKPKRKKGRQIEPVHLGLTPNKLVMATDILPSAKESKPWCLRNIDPEIETFELISVYPIDCVNLSIFHTKKRQSIKAHFYNNRIVYYELGGFEKKKMFWNLWCERLKFLSPNEISSSRSETSVGSSSSNSTVYLINAKTKFPQNKLPQLWCTFGACDGSDVKSKWNEKDLYLGKKWEELSPHLFQPLPGHSLTNMKKRDENKLFTIAESSTTKNITKNDKIFIPETETQFSRLDNSGVKPVKNVRAIWQHQIMEMIDNAVYQWENPLKFRNINRTEISHRRRYAFNPRPHFHYGLGPWNVRKGERDSVQVKSVVSEVTIYRQHNDSELRLPVSKCQLSATISVDALLNKPKMINTILVNSSCWNQYSSVPIKIFWTPEYWYRPRSPVDLYQELQSHLRKIRTHHQNFNVKSTFTLPDKHRSETSLEYMRRKLQINTVLSIWDFDSITIAYQLTIIDRDLFLKITEIELDIVVWQKSCKNAPNIFAIIAFSHRICCLVATEIIEQDIVKTRSRIICRFISIADNCNRICNFQSCKSVLSGLQSPPVYRLHLTWAYIRRKHFSKYQLFEKLCRVYRDPRLPIYQRAFCLAKQKYSYLPYIGDILLQLMDKIPKPCIKQRRRLIDEKQNNPLPIENISLLKNENKFEAVSSLPNIFQRFLSTFGISTKANHDNFKYNNAHTNETIFVNFKQQSKQNPHPKILENDKVCKPQSRNYILDNCTPKIYFDDNQIKRLNEVTELLKIFRKSVSNFALCTNDLANDYLLKSRYKEHKDNFFLSFHIEPKRG